MILGVEHYADIAPEVRALAIIQHEEVSWSDLPFNPDDQAYNDPSIVMFTGRHLGILVAYSIYVIRNHVHSKGVLTAFNDTIYVHPDFRGYSLSFLEFAEKLLKQLQVQAISYCVTEDLDWGPVLKARGYKPVERVWMRRV